MKKSVQKSPKMPIHQERETPLLRPARLEVKVQKRGQREVRKKKQ